MLYKWITGNDSILGKYLGEEDGTKGCDGDWCLVLLTLARIAHNRQLAVLTNASIDCLG